MPPNVTFTREHVVQAGFEIVQEQGLKALSARRVAQRLRSSTAPVYSCFQSMRELEMEVIRKAKDLLFDYATRPYTERVFLNMGTGVVLFARDQRELYRALFLERSDFRDVVDEFLRALREEMIHDPRFTRMSDEDRGELLNKMWIFTHGLASLICVGLIEPRAATEEYIVAMLLDVGSVVIGAALENVER